MLMNFKLKVHKEQKVAETADASEKGCRMWLQCSKNGVELS